MRVGVLFMNEDSVVRDCRGGIVISTFGLSEHNILKPILNLFALGAFGVTLGAITVSRSDQRA